MPAEPGVKLWSLGDISTASPGVSCSFDSMVLCTSAVSVRSAEFRLVVPFFTTDPLAAAAFAEGLPSVAAEEARRIGGEKRPGGGAACALAPRAAAAAGRFATAEVPLTVARRCRGRRGLDAVRGLDAGRAASGAEARRSVL